MPTKVFSVRKVDSTEFSLCLFRCLANTPSPPCDTPCLAIVNDLYMCTVIRGFMYEVIYKHTSAYQHNKFVYYYVYTYLLPFTQTDTVFCRDNCNSATLCNSCICTQVMYVITHINYY